MDPEGQRTLAEQIGSAVLDIGQRAIFSTIGSLAGNSPHLTVRSHPELSNYRNTLRLQELERQLDQVRSRNVMLITRLQEVDMLKTMLAEERRMRMDLELMLITFQKMYTDLITEQTSEESNCGICHELIEKPYFTITLCAHTFHKVCLDRWVAEKVSTGLDVSCPICRRIISST